MSLRFLVRLPSMEEAIVGNLSALLKDEEGVRGIMRGREGSYG